MSKFKKLLLASPFFLITAACTLLRDFGSLSTHTIECVQAETDRNPNVKPAEVALICGAKATPDVLKIISDIIADRNAANAARRAGLAAPLHDAGADAQ